MLTKDIREARKNKISFGMLAVAFLFLFNPNMAIIDPLPDIFGYLILSVALSKISMISESLYDAKRAFERLVIVDAGKIVSIFWVFGMDALSERNISLLLWSFVFAVLECIFAIPAYIKLFDGFTSLGNFYPNVAILGRKGAKRASYTDAIKSFSIFFVIFKALLTVLPELTALTTSQYDETSYLVNLYRYIGVIRGFCIIPVLAVGFAWLVSAIKYFRRASNDKDFVNAINEEYAKKKITRNGAFVIKDVRIASIFLVMASIFTIDFSFDGVNILPDILVVIALSISLFYFSRAAKIKKSFAVVTFLLFTVATLFEDYIRYYFADNFYYNAINKNGEAFGYYLATVIAVAVEGAIFVLLYVAIARALRFVVSEHTGYVVGREIESEGEKKQILAVQNRLNKNFSSLIDFAVLCALADTFASLYGAFYAFLNKNFGWMTLLSLIFALLLVGMTVKAVSELKEAVQTKYMLQ